jgi:hypothetical protein
MALLYQRLKQPRWEYVQELPTLLTIEGFGGTVASKSYTKRCIGKNSLRMQGWN